MTERTTVPSRGASYDSPTPYNGIEFTDWLSGYFRG
jgi:hypothetical protein